MTAVAQRPVSTVDAPAEPRSRRQWGWVLAAAVPTVLTGLHAAFYGQWIVDDAGLSFAYARSLATGAGPVLQAGSVPVEGFSNPTWVAVLAVGRALHLFDHGSWFGTPDLVLYPKLVALLCCFGVFALMFSIARTVSRRPVADHPRCGHGDRGGAVIRHLDHERFGERALRPRRHGDRRRPCPHGGVWSAARPENRGGSGDPRGARGVDPARRHRFPRRISHRDRPHRRARDYQAHRDSEPDLVGGLRDSSWCLSDMAATHLRRLSAQHRTCQGARTAERRRSGQAGVTR